jgi:type II secretory pathway component PulC
MRMWLSALWLAGCATTQQPAMQKGAESAGDPVTEMSTEPLTGNPSKPSEPQSSTGAQMPVAMPMPMPIIDRQDLDAVLAQSPGYFLQHIETKPQFRGGHFHGWRLVSFFPGDPRFAGVDLQAGDVVTRINGRPIEQPEQFMAVWTALRSSNELVVDVERAGAPRTLRWQIHDR